MAANDLCAVSDVQAFLSLPAEQDTALLQSLITSASAFVANWLSRDIFSQTYVETVNGNGGDRMVLKNYPVTAIDSMGIDGLPLNVSTLTNGGSADGYVFDDSTLYLRGWSLSPGVQNITVTYTAGYDSVPADLAQACVEIVATKYKRRTNLEVSGKTLNGETISYTMTDIPASAKVVLSQYQRVYM